MKRTLTLILLAFFGLTAVFAQESPRWLRKNAISPDGKQVAFSHELSIISSPEDQYSSIFFHFITV